MAAKKSAATPKTQPANTSAPTAGENAEVSPKGTSSGASVTGAGQPAPQTAADSATPATPIVERTETSPEGESTAAETRPGTGNVVAQLIVSAKVEGFRRAGRAWSKSAETISVEDFTEAQIDALFAEPMLAVAFVEAA